MKVIQEMKLADPNSCKGCYFIQEILSQGGWGETVFTGDHYCNLGYWDDDRKKAIEILIKEMEKSLSKEREGKDLTLTIKQRNEKFKRIRDIKEKRIVEFMLGRKESIRQSADGIRPERCKKENGL
jgi:hypothetical protein